MLCVVQSLWVISWSQTMNMWLQLVAQRSWQSGANQAPDYQDLRYPELKTRIKSWINCLNKQRKHGKSFMGTPHIFNSLFFFFLFLQLRRNKWTFQLFHHNDCNKLQQTVEIEISFSLCFSYTSLFVPVLLKR